MRALLFFIFVLTGYASLSQNFVAQAELTGVAEDGFYSISISPEISVYLNSQFTNIRIYDNNNKEVPYLFQEEAPHNMTEVFREYSIIDKSQVGGCCTTLLLHNPDESLMNNINLDVKNADVTKEATLLGSDDKVQWFAVKQHFLLHPAKNAKGTSDIKVVDFPLSNYKYYSLRIDDSTSAPLNILKAGYFEVRMEQGKYAGVPVKEVIKSDSLKEKKSFLHIRFDGSPIIDKIELAMSGAPYFLRRATVHVSKKRTLKGGRTEMYYDPVQEIEITSRQPTSIELPTLKVNELLITIDNEDNPSLEVEAFKAFQLNRYVTAWLEAGKSYVIKAGDQDQAAPTYDISFFRDSIPDNPQILEAEAMTLLTKGAANPSTTFFTTRAFIWAAVILVIVILGFMSVRMLNEAGKRS